MTLLWWCVTGAVAGVLVSVLLHWLIRDAVADGVGKALREYEFPIDLDDLRDLREAYETVHRKELERAGEISE